jgi:hypothetical protein
LLPATFEGGRDEDGDGGDRQVRGREAGWLSVILPAASLVVTAVGCDRAVAPNANHTGPAIVAMLPVADALDVGRYVTDD